MRIEVLIVDDHAVVREGLKAVLADEADFAVVGEAGDLPAARRLVDRVRGDVLVLDISMSGETSWELLKVARRRAPPLRVLVLSAYREESYAIHALRSGADGYLNKESAPEQLVHAIRRIAGGGKYVGPELADTMARSLEAGRQAGPGALSSREFAVLELIAAGKSLVSIAAALHLSPKTVTTYRGRILVKLGLRNNAEVTRYAMHQGLIG